MTKSLAIFGLASVLALPAYVRAADAPPPAADPKPAKAVTPVTPARPLLSQLSAETQDLYRSLQGGVLRVQMPPPNWANDMARRDNRFDRYNLDPDVKRQLLTNQRGAPTQPTTQPLAAAPPAATQERPSATDVPPGQGVIIVVPPPNAAEQQQREMYVNPSGDARSRGGPAGANAKAHPPVVPNNVAIVLDDQGHVLVPVYVEREAAAAGDTPIRLIAPDGEAVEAKFIGSDAQTNVTVLQLPRSLTRRAAAKGAGEEAAAASTPPAVVKPVKLSKAKPEEGALVLYISPTDAAGRLGVWNNNARDYGVVVGVDGQILGVARYGQFLSGSACQLIADQIIRHGSVKRATLGVIITQIDKEDPARQQRPALGDRPAVRVDQVMKGSPAEKGGLRPGDVLLALAGEPINDIPSIAAAVAARDGNTPLQVLRGDEVIEVTVDLRRK